MNPYQILGREKGESLEELRSRYEELRAIYSEQMFSEGEVGNQAARKLTELNEAWSMILSEHEAKSAEEIGGDDYAKIQSLINQGDLSKAQSLMDNISVRDGKWHYYQSVIYFKRDWMVESKKQLELAIECEPDNQKYRDTLNRLILVMGNPRSNPEDFGRYPYPDQQMNGNCLSNCCMAYCCTELCCNAMRCCG